MDHSTSPAQDASSPAIAWLQRTVRTVEPRPLMRVAAVTMLSYVGAWALLAWAGFGMDHWPEGQPEMLGAVLVSGVLVGSLGLFAVQMLNDMVRQLRGRSVPAFGERAQRLAQVALWSWILLPLHALGVMAYFNVKPAIPLLRPGWHDGALEALERGLFGGVLPSLWLLEHSSRRGLWAWDLLYQCFGLFLILSFSAALYSRGFRDGCRLVVALILGQAADLVGTLLLPTRGPIFVHRSRFRRLRGLSSWELSEYLLHTVERYAAAPGQVYASGGISAMPSFHVFGWTCGVLAWSALPRWLRLVGWTSALFNWAATVALGWHYWLDGAVSLLLVLLLWPLSGWLTGGAVRGGAQQPEDASRAQARAPHAEDHGADPS